jgi:hypothetical protein
MDDFSMIRYYINLNNSNVNYFVDEVNAFHHFNNDIFGYMLFILKNYNNDRKVEILIKETKNNYEDNFVPFNLENDDKLISKYTFSTVEEAREKIKLWITFQ